MKKRSFFSTCLALALSLVLVLSLSACSADNKGSDYATSEDYMYDEYLETGDSSSAGSSSEESNTVKDTRKIIETISYSVQTKTFDDFVTELEKKALELGGYIESSDVSGNTDEDDSPRYATYVFRIPTEKVDSFTTVVSDNATVTNKSVTTEDVTLQYVDIESRIDALKTEKEALEELLESAQSTSDIIEIRDMLTDVIYEIESNESQLRTFDSLIEYTSITVDVTETEHPEIVKEQTVWQRIGSNLSENFTGVWEFLVNTFVFLVSSIPFLLLFGVYLAVIFVIVKIIKVRNKKAKEKKAKKAEEINNKLNN